MWSIGSTIINRSTTVSYTHLVAKKYYEYLEISDQIKSIDYDLTDKVYGGAFGTLDEYKNSNSIIFLVTTTDENIPRIIILTRNDKDSEWGVVDEGY